MPLSFGTEPAGDGRAAGHGWHKTGRDLPCHRLAKDRPCRCPPARQGRSIQGVANFRLRLVLAAVGAVTTSVDLGRAGALGPDFKGRSFERVVHDFHRSGWDAHATRVRPQQLLVKAARLQAKAIACHISVDAFLRHLLFAFDPFIFINAGDHRSQIE